MPDFDTSKYDLWNESRKKLRMTADEFAQWHSNWLARAAREQEGLAEKCTRSVAVLACKKDPILPLGTDIDRWFLRACGISTEAL